MNVDHAIIVKTFEGKINSPLKRIYLETINENMFIYLEVKFQKHLLQKILSEKIMCSKFFFCKT